ncbi:MAG: class I SAM-dependent methyltransferase [Planctomycetota bacterium]|nr:class I SAM-dependent methyltransferase [Planctomycetota bacterium]
MWAHRATTIKSSNRVTHADVFQRELEINELSQNLTKDDVVLDMGCGNGWATDRLALFCKHIHGVDYSNEMIERAKAEPREHSNVSWGVADVLAFDEVGKYDVVITVRCLINVVDVSLQQKAIANLCRALKPNGRLMMMEGVSNGRTALNHLRESVGLTAMPAVVHNLDFDVEQTMAYMGTLFSSVSFSSNGVYDLITRVLYPYMIHPDQPTYESKYHEAALAIAGLIDGVSQISRFGMFKAVK